MNAHVSARTSDMFAEALHNATASASVMNYPSIYEGFAAKGIAEDDIQPRVNVFTFNAWKALGRSVRKGEHGVKVCTWVPMTKKDATGESQPIGRKPRMTTVFHVSQTEPSKYANGGEVNAADLADAKLRAEKTDQEAAAVLQDVLGNRWKVEVPGVAAAQSTVTRFVTVGSEEVAL